MMKNRIKIYGTQIVKLDCAECGIPDEIEVDLSSYNYLEHDSEINLYLNSEALIDDFKMKGWEEIDGRFVCPDCAEELKENNNESKS